MNKKRNVSFIKPEDPAFLKALKKQAGYDDRNHKFDKLENDEKDFVDDEESEQPQVVVLKKGDLTAEEAEAEKMRIEKKESEAKADLSQRVIFRSKTKDGTTSEVNKRKINDNESPLPPKEKKTRQLLSFNDDDNEDDEER